MNEVPAQAEAETEAEAEAEASVGGLTRRLLGLLETQPQAQQLSLERLAELWESLQLHQGQQQEEQVWGFAAEEQGESCTRTRTLTHTHTLVHVHT